MVKPISPDECRKLNIPDEVIESFNELIQEKFRGKSATVLQDEVIERILSKFNHYIGRQEIYDNCWLDVEDLFGEAGWKVVYDKPGYNESYPAKFEFTKK